MRTSRRLLAAPAAIVLLGALTACGGSTPAAGPSPTAATPSAVATAQETAEAETDGLTVATFVQTITAAQATAGSYDFTMVMSGGGESMNATGSVHLAGEAQDLAMVMDVPGMGALELRSVGGLTYLNMGEVTGGKFLAIDPDDASNPLAAGLGQMPGEVDPSQGLAGQEAAIVSVTKKGAPEQLDGVEVQGYDVVIDPSKMPDQLAELEASLPAGASAPETLTYSYLVDADGLVRKVAFDLMGTAAEMTFTHWGAGTAVVAPTADQISTENPFAG